MEYRESLVRAAMKAGIDAGPDEVRSGEAAFMALRDGVQTIIDELAPVITSFNPSDVPLVAVALRVILDECKSNMDEDDMELVDALSGISASGEEAEHE